MKKLASFLFAFLMSSILVNAQFSIDQITPGTLSGLLTTNEMSNLTSLKITGNIDARDFKTIRDSMPMIETLDLSQVTIVSYTGTQATLGTANTFYPENTIPRNAFYLAMEKSKLSTVIQPSNLMAIGRSAYNQCSGLSNINWPSGLTSIGYSAFYNCRSLKTAVIPPGVTAIDTSTFRNCISLTSVTVPATVKEIRYGAFLQCSELTTLNFMPGSQLSHIGIYAFGVCPNLTSFTLQPTVRFSA